MNSLLSETFLVTLFFGALGWAITHFVDRVVSSPVIEYQVDITPVPNRQGWSKISVPIRNLSRTHAHRGVVIRLQRAMETPNLKFSKEECKITAVAPTSLGEKEGTPFCDEAVAEFRVTVLPPQGGAVLTANFVGEGKVTVRGGPLGDKGGEFYLAESSLETWLARHEFGVVFGGLFLWLIALLRWAWYRRGTEQKA